MRSLAADTYRWRNARIDGGFVLSIVFSRSEKNLVHARTDIGGQGSEPAGVTGGGTGAAGADGSGFVWSPDAAAVHHTTGYGSSWAVSTGIPAGATVEPDRRNPKKFYGRHLLRIGRRQTVFVGAKIGGVRGVLRSTDAGAHWTRINDDAHRWAWTGAAITGDPRVHGRPVRCPP